MTDLLSEAKHMIYALIAALFGIGAHLWRKTEGKVEAMESDKASKSELRDLERRIDAKADNAEMNRQRDNIAELFDGQTAIRKEMHENHIATMKALSDVAVTVANLSGHVRK